MRGPSCSKFGWNEEYQCILTEQELFDSWVKDDLMSSIKIGIQEHAQRSLLMWVKMCQTILMTVFPLVDQVKEEIVHVEVKGNKAIVVWPKEERATKVELCVEVVKQLQDIPELQNRVRVKLM
ncbi:hypothetical protein Csa_007482 [Cucumis sativus]|uniref:Uncharacterized protein n=1 Tax=Cucumis sativus TaxID=3659 RepID=A0A0A0M343_CUCSA|nr:hypothetical protein Csa_007482 [Cucumis sativus]